MRKGHAACRHDHEHAEHALDRNEMLLLFCLRVRLDPIDEQGPQNRNANGNGNGDDVTVADAQGQADVFQAFKNCDESNRECRKENVHGHIATRPRKRILVHEEQFLYASVYQVRDEAGSDSGETDDRADNRMRRRNRPSLARGDQQPGASRKQRCEHSINQQLRRARK